MRVRNFIKKNYKIGIGVMIGLIVSIVGVYASDTTSSLNVSYNNSTSGLKSTNMQGAIDELNEKVNKPCKVIKGTGRNTNDEIICGTEEFYVLYTSGDSINVVTKYPIEGGCVSLSQGGYCVSKMENPSYAQNKNCGSEAFRCGSPAISKYKDVLVRIGLSDGIQVSNLSIENMNSAGCSISCSTEDCSGNCPSSFDWIKNLALNKELISIKNISNVTCMPVLINNNSINLSSNCNQVIEGLPYHAVVTIPINDVLIK